MLRKLLVGGLVLVIAVVALPPLWFWLFPSPAGSLPAPGTAITLPSGTVLNVLDQGSGPAVVLVHGLPGSAYDWRELTPGLNARGLRTIAIDRAGYGHSSVRSDGRNTMAANGEDLLALLNELDVRDATVVGWSYGGPVAMFAASQDARRIGRLVLIGTGGPDADDAEIPRPNAAMRLMYSDAAIAWRAAVPPVTRGLQAVLSDVGFSGGPQPDWWLADLAAAFERRETTATYRNEMFAAADGAQLELQAVRVPVLLIHADDDRLAPVAIARYMAPRLPDARLVEVAGASHMLPVTHAPLLAAEIAAFAGR